MIDLECIQMKEDRNQSIYVYNKTLYLIKNKRYYFVEILSYEIIFHGHFLSLWIKYFELFLSTMADIFFLIWDKISPTFDP